MPLTFEELSREVAIHFLQSVVVVDDLASMRNEVGAHPHPLVTPKRETIGVSIPALSDTKAEEYNRHKLNAKLLINTFAEKGLICGVIKPEPGEPFEDKVFNAALRADITVLDWQLSQVEDSDRNIDVTSIIKKIIELEKSQNRIRLIAIYSAVNPDELKGKIKEILEPFGGFVNDGNDYTFIRKAIRITVFAKDGTISTAASRKVKESELPDKLISEFTTMTMGLLSNAALASLAALRLNTHRILGNFPPDLDAPYLTNRALLAEPEEAEEYLTVLIAEELQTIIEEADIGRSANINTIMKWLKAKSDAQKTYVLKNPKGGSSANETFTHEELNDLLNNGKELWQCKSRVKTQIMHELALTDMFHCDEETCKLLDEKFIFAAIMRSHYGGSKPKLKFGTIVKKQEAEKSLYYVCVQQPCDCIIRNKNITDRGFVFLPLLKPVDKYFHIIVKEANEYIKFVCSERPYDIKNIEFSFPTGFRGLIEAEEMESHLCFKDAQNNKYIWIGELKPQFSRRFLHTVTVKLTRAAVNEPEWLRRHSNKVSHD